MREVERIEKKRCSQKEKAMKEVGRNLLFK